MQEIQQGIELFKKGLFDQADTLFRKALETEPSHFVALMHRGLISLKQRTPIKAQRFFEAAVREEPNNPLAHVNLAISHRVSGHHEKAIFHYRQGIRLDPNSVVILADYIGFLIELGETKLARLKLTALSVDRRNHDSIINLAYTLSRKAGDLEFAKAYFSEMLGLFQDNPLLRFQYANTLRDLGNTRGAIAVYEDVIRTHPSFAEAYSNLGCLQADMGHFREAERSHDAALKFAQNPAPFLVNYSVSLEQEQRFDIALQVLEKAVNTVPSLPQAKINLGLAQLRLKTFQPGWQNWRTPADTTTTAIWPGNKHQSIQTPHWDGGDIQGKTLLVLSEQGYGDSLHFCRYLKLVQDQFGCRVLFQCQASLTRLLQSSLRVDLADPLPAPPPDHDVFCSLLDLPRLFLSRQHQHFAAGTYLQAPTQPVAEREKPSPGSLPLRIGVAWRGNPKHGNDAFRSVPLTAFAELAERHPMIEWCSLQVLCSPYEKAELEQHQIKDAAKSFSDFSDAASAVMPLDLIISVDTATAHLAAGLGKPTWVLLTARSDWRWFTEETRSPWYPSVRLFRQPIHLDWPSVFANVDHALLELQHQRGSGPTDC